MDHRALGNLRPINWELVSLALKYYGRFGYKYVEVPWAVEDKAVNPTLPDGKKASRLILEEGDLALVGSAEQSFIAMMQAGELGFAKYVAASPCFRDDQISVWHQKTFFKVELIEICHDIPTPEQVLSMIDLARNFFFVNSLEGGKCQVVQTAEGYDIEADGIEIGSYGVRSLGDCHWIYGTGLAEPRYSQVMDYCADNRVFRIFDEIVAERPKE